MLQSHPFHLSQLHPASAFVGFLLRVLAKHTESFTLLQGAYEHDRSH